MQGTNRLAGGEVWRWAECMMGIKEGTCWAEHCVLYVGDGSPNSTLETNLALSVN